MIIELLKTIKSIDNKNLYLPIVSFLGVFVGGNLNSVLTNLFYAKKLTGLMSKINIITQIFGIVLKILLFYILGFWGLPLAFSITSMTTTLVLYSLYDKKISKLKIRYILNYSFKIVTISVVSVVVTKFFVSSYFDNWLIIIVLDWLIFVSLYIFLSLKFEDDISQLIKKRLLIKFFKNDHNIYR